MMRGKRENFFSREKKPNVGFVILFPLSRHSLGDGGSHPFKKSGVLYTTAAAQMQGARLTAGRRRRSDCLTTFETLTIIYRGDAQRSRLNADPGLIASARESPANPVA